MEFVRKGIVGGRCWNIEHVYKCFVSVLSQARRPATWGNHEEQEQVPGFLAVAHRHFGQEEDQ